MKSIACILFCSILFGCSHVYRIQTPARASSVTGTSFYKTAFSFGWQQRDSMVVQELFSGNLPSFLKKFVPIRVSIQDALTGKNIEAIYYVSPDYLSIGTDHDWARVNITPRAAQRIADRFDCFLPTQKIVDDIYNAAPVKLEPLPMYAFRDSTPTMYHHHLMVEGQRRGKTGLIAGIQKDVVISGKISRDTKPDRVAIYGWHQLDGHPIQPLYIGHVYWWVDYSQGIRLVYRKMKVDKKWIDYVNVLRDPILRRLICDEEYCDFYKYPY